MPTKRSRSKSSNLVRFSRNVSLQVWSAAVFIALVVVAGGYIIYNGTFAAGGYPLSYCATSIQDGQDFAQGSSGSCVQAIQYMVNSVHAGDLLLGGRWPGASAFLATDGSFGPLTAAGVKAAQKDVGISADGVVGPITMSALCSVGGEEVTGDSGSGGENHTRTVYGEEWAAKIFGQFVNQDDFYSPKCPKPFGTYKAL